MNILWKDGLVSMLEKTGHFYCCDSVTRKLHLYEADGTFLSTFDFYEGNTSVVGTDILWSDLWNGYFFLHYGDGLAPELVFWDINVPISGEDFVLTEE